MTDGKKPGVAFGATVALAVVLVGYPLSAGPFVWLIARGYLSEAYADRVAQSFYGPITWLHEHGPDPIHDVLDWYVRLWD